jgi:cell division protease FtsH
MYPEVWFPLDYEILPNVKTGPTLFSGEGWQILESKGSAKKIFIAQEELLDAWTANGLVDETYFDPVRFGNRNFIVLVSDEKVMAPALQCPRPNDFQEAQAFSFALGRTRKKDKLSPLSNSVYTERLAIFLPVRGSEEVMSDDILLGCYLTGGVRVSCYAYRRVRALAPWLSDEGLESIWEIAGLQRPGQVSEKEGGAEFQKKKSFELSGRPELEAFLREHVIDILENQERYQSLGVDFPSGIVLHGPPGCGKTFAVDRLLEYLDWPSFRVDSGTIGSPYIHQTSKKIGDVFEEAMRSAPSVVVIDEMEAFVSDREIGGGQSHRIEEVAEFLRKIPEALSRKVLVIGMTNRIELIDPAILRRGRFDHVIEVGMPTREEVESLLNKLLSERPCEKDLLVDEAVLKLVGRPLADAAFFVGEAARLAARAGKKKIDNESIRSALGQAKQGRTPSKRPIGF